MHSQKLPLQHPEYRYPEASNPYSQKLERFKGLAFSDNATESNVGQWKKPGRDLHVEVGCNGGHVILEWAVRSPSSDYIGIDWKFKQIYRAAEKAEKRGLSNVRFLRAHADRIRYMFAPGEIDFLYLFFPDPWPKKAHWKNRYINETNLRMLAPLLSAGGVFEIKTDHPGYFEWMEEAVAKTPELWEVIERDRDIHCNHPSPTTLTFPEVTLFERLFIRDGIKIQRLKLRKREP